MVNRHSYEPLASPRFLFCCLARNGLLRQSVASGEAVPIGEILSLATAVQAISLTARMESRRRDPDDQTSGEDTLETDGGGEALEGTSDPSKE
jgi:hypothetical protein